MPVINPTETIEVYDFSDFCDKFEIVSKYNVGDDGTDEELIVEELNKIKKMKFIINFIEDRADGYFRIQRFET